MFIWLLCRYRTARLLHTVAMRLRKHTRKLGAFQAWNKCLNHLLELARAHVEAVMLTNMLDGANKCEDLDARKSIKVCHQSYLASFLCSLPAQPQPHTNSHFGSSKLLFAPLIVQRYHTGCCSQPMISKFPVQWASAGNSSLFSATALLAMQEQLLVLM